MARHEASTPADPPPNGPSPGPEVPLATLLEQLETSRTPGETMTTNRGELVLYASPDPDVKVLVIKQVPDWTAANARGLSLTHEACRVDAVSHGVAPFAAAVHSWGQDPVYLCSEWVAGTSMDQRMATELAGLPPKDASNRSIEMTARTAALIARYHRAMSECELIESGLPLKSSTAAEAGLSIRLIAMLRGTRGVARSERVRSIDDPGPHNTVLGEDERLWLIDLPADFQNVMVERDIARLSSRVVGAIHRHSKLIWVSYHPIVDAAIEGYERIGSPEARPIDRSLVYACLASDAAKKVALTRRRLPPGTRLECFVRESVAATSLGARAIWFRFRT